jgi:GntR family transcriptional regulator
MTSPHILPKPPPSAEGLPALASLPTFSPLYKQIKALLLKQLDAGVWKAGDALPSEIELAQQMTVSQGTVRKAIDELVAEHLLLRRQGKGTYVASHTAAGVQYRFLRLRPNVGQRQPAQSTILSCKLLPAPAWVLAALALAPKEKAFQIERTLAFGDTSPTPVVFETIWLRAELFTGLTAERMSNYKGAMYALFEAEFGVRMIRAEEQVRAVAATTKLATVMGLTVGAPLLQATRTSYSYKQQAVELRQAWYLTGDFYYWSELD